MFKGRLVTRMTQGIQDRTKVKVNKVLKQIKGNSKEETW